jgi:hypothetical protein
MLNRYVLPTLAILLSSVLSAGADPIRIVSVDRRLAVLANLADPDGNDRHTDIHVGYGSTAVSAALGSGTASATATLSSSISDSSFFVTFHLDTAHLFDFSGTFGASGALFEDVRQIKGQWFAQLFDTSGAIVFFDHSSTESGTRANRGRLEPGDYNFNLLVDAGAFASSFVRGATSGSADSHFDVTLDLTAADPSASPTPEPGSLMLLGVGAVGLFARARNRRPSTCG